MAGVRPRRSAPTEAEQRRRRRAAARPARTCRPARRPAPIAPAGMLPRVGRRQHLDRASRHRMGRGREARAAGRPAGRSRARPTPGPAIGAAGGSTACEARRAPRRPPPRRSRSTPWSRSGRRAPQAGRRASIAPRTAASEAPISSAVRSGSTTADPEVNRKTGFRSRREAARPRLADIGREGVDEGERREPERGAQHLERPELPKAEGPQDRGCEHRGSRVATCPPCRKEGHGAVRSRRGWPRSASARSRPRKARASARRAGGGWRRAR